MVNEIYWTAVQFVGDLVNFLITGYLFHRFIKPFLPESGRTRIVGITYIIVMLISKYIPYEMHGMTAYAIGVAISFFAMYFIDKKAIEQKIFLCVTFYLLEWISWGIVLLPEEFLYQLSLLLPSTAWLQFGLYLIREIVLYTLYYFIMALLLKVIHRAYKCKEENLTKRELALMLAPSLSIAAGRMLVSYFSDSYLNETSRYIWNDHPGYHWVMFLYQTVAFAAMLTVVMIYQSIKDSQQKEKENAVLAKQMEDMEKHIREVENLYKEIRSLKHDMGNHVMTLSHLYGKEGEAGKYLEELKEEFTETAGEIKSGNPVTDVILGEKQKEAEEKGITFQYEFHYPKGSKVSAFDISVILNNAIDNAIEAAKVCEKPYIRILSYRKNNAYMIEIRNSIEERRVIDKESGLPITTKDKNGHGFGLVNIRKVARKYFGDIDIEQDGKEFALVVMMMME